MKSYKIAVIAGDGIGPEIISEGVRVLECVSKLDGGFAFEFTHFPWGCEYYLKNGKMMRRKSKKTWFQLQLTERLLRAWHHLRCLYQARYQSEAVFPQ